MLSRRNAPMSPSLDVAGRIAPHFRLGQQHLPGTLGHDDHGMHARPGFGWDRKTVSRAARPARTVLPPAALPDTDNLLRHVLVVTNETTRRRWILSFAQSRYLTTRGMTSQISFAYPAVVRSLENLPEAATFRMALRVEDRRIRSNPVYRQLERSLIEEPAICVVQPGSGPCREAVV
jgi:hypothetical protein